MKKIVFNDFSVGGECNLFHYGIPRELLQKHDFEFYAGNLYGIIGEFGDGGAALSCGITGNTKYYKGRIFIDEVECSIDHVIENSWYVGNDLFKYKSKGLFFNKPKFNKNTIKEQIEYGIRCKKTNESFSTIQNMFNVSNDRIVRNINYVSGERWKASAAIGYANGRKIFCYPWMNTKDVEHLREQLSHTIKVLQENGCIVIMPTTKEENIKKISDKGCAIFL